MTNSPISGAAETATPAAALPTSSSPTPGVQETPSAPVPDLQIVSSTGGNSPTVVTAKPVIPLAALPKTIGLPDRQRLALQALAAGNSVQDVARIAGVNLSTLFRWRKYHPKFIAAWNAWQAESQKTARDLLIAANEHAARTVLRATQNGNVSASLTVLKGMGTLAPQKPGPEFAQAVKTDLSIKSDELKLSLGGLTRDLKKQIAQSKAKAKKAAAEAENQRKFFQAYAKIPPLPRPVTVEAIEQSVKASSGLLVTYPHACSITITAVTGDRRPLIGLIVQYDHDGAEVVQKQLHSLPKRLSHFIVADRVEEIARKFESLGATVEFRPAWHE